MKTISKYTLSEELLNGISHILAAILSLIGTYFLLKHNHSSPKHIAAALIFGLSMFLLFSFSGTLHMLPPSKAKVIFAYLDQIGIALMIAGTYTPFALVALHNTTGWLLFGAEWLLAAIAIIMKIFDKEGLEDSTKSRFVIIYLIMGWLGIFAAKQIYQAIGLRGVLLILGAGVLYSSGIIFFRWHKLKFHHLIWHLFVVAAAVLLYFSIYLYVF